MQRERITVRTLAVMGSALTVLVSLTAGADEGVLEINQACAVNTGCFAGDTAGFIITITSPGSYRLTSDLDAGVDKGAIKITASDVTVDLNGFRILGSGTAFADGVFLSGATNVELRNGTIEGFGRHGIFAVSSSPGARIIDIRAFGQAGTGIRLESEGALVRGCTASGNLIGIKVSDGGLVLDSVMENNSNVGLNNVSGSGYARNVLSDNNGADANAQVSGAGTEIGVNLCGVNTTCP